MKTFFFMKPEKNFELVRFEAIRDKDGNAKDWAFTVVATGKSESTLLKYAKMKGLDMDYHTIEYIGKDED